VSQPEFRSRLELNATISPSEDPAKVVQALKNILGEANCEVSLTPTAVKLLTDDSKALVHIRDQLRDRHVRTAARKQMLLNSAGRSASLMLSRQAASAGVVALCGSAEESPLGPIYLTVRSDKLDATIDWLTAYAG
jgi:predicted RNA binding protein with dsRBD fold (UPF0201 family)